MTASPYDTGLDRNAANHQPLTPLTYLERAATVNPDKTAIIHGPLRRSYAEFYARARRLASALADAGVGKNDTVAALLFNTPAMLEAHYGVPMCGAVLNAMNTRLDLNGCERALLNVGSIGQPRDENPKAACGIYDSETGIYRLERVGYDIRTTGEKIRQAGLAGILADRLRFGR